MPDPALPSAIVTERLRLRLLRAADLRPAATVLTDPDLALGLPLGTTFGTLDAVEAWLAEVVGSYPTEAPRFAYAVTPKDGEDAFLGLAIVAPHDEAPDARRAGVALRMEARGHGYGREAGRAITTHAFGTLGARFVDAIVALENESAVRTATRLGYKHLESAPQHGPTAQRFRAHQPPGGWPPRRRRR